MNGYYQMTDSPVDFKKVTGETMGAQSTVHSPIGLKFSIAGAAPYNLTEPAMPGYAVTADAAPRTGAAGEISQPLQVLYEGATQQLPVEIRDRDNGDQLVTTKSTPVKTDATYNLTKEDLSPLVPENYVYASAEHVTGTLKVDDSGKVTNNPVIVYVTHKIKKYTHPYTRTIKYVTPDTITPPDPVVQTVNQHRKEDMVTKVETILDKDLSFPAVETPNLTGYVPDVYIVPKQVIDNAQDNYTVTYSGTIGLSVPTSVDFDTHDISSANQTYNAKTITSAQGNQVAPYVQVSDTRGTGSGWHLAVKQDKKFTNDRSNDVLRGAYVKFARPTLQDLNSATPAGVTGNTVTLAAGGPAQTIMTATSGNGGGVTYGIFGTVTDGTANGAQLVVPGGSALIGAYNTTLTWTLGATPA